MQIYGFFNWGKNLKNENVKTRKFNFKISLLVISLCAIGSVVIGFLLSMIPSQRLSFLDATSNCVNLCGVILMSLRYMESWWLWLINNILDLIIWICVLISGNGSNAIMMVVTCVMYLSINVYGIIKWMRNSRVERKSITL